MEKLLIMGVNTRGLINSASKLPYQTYSVSYYFTIDCKTPYQDKHVLNQKSGKSCGFFETNYSPQKLLSLSSQYLENTDYIVLSAGISPNDFKGEFREYKKKIIGNTKTKDIEDKYRFYKKIKNKYLTPKTFKIKYKNDANNDYSNVSEAIEIAKQYEGTAFIVKPLEGSGGYGVSYLKYSKGNEFKNSLIALKEKYSNYEDCDFLVQEYIQGTNISSSVLSTNREAKTLVVSRMLTESDFGKKNSFRYCGNIVPLNCSNNINMKQINNISEEIISKFKLIGSNGIDMIIDKDSTFDAKNSKFNDENSAFDEPYIIEVNPRFQGTYECIEEILEINLLDAHIKACAGELIEIPKPDPNEYSNKRIIYSNEKIKAGNLNINNNIHDIPLKGAIIEKDEPLITIVTSKDSFKNAENIIKDSIRKIDENIISLNNSNKN